MGWPSDDNLVLHVTCSWEENALAHFYEYLCLIIWPLIKTILSSWCIISVLDYLINENSPLSQCANKTVFLAMFLQAKAMLLHCG